MEERGREERGREERGGGGERRGRRRGNWMGACTHWNFQKSAPIAIVSIICDEEQKKLQ